MKENDEKAAARTRQDYQPKSFLRNDPEDFLKKQRELLKSYEKVLTSFGKPKIR